VWSSEPRWPAWHKLRRHRKRREHSGAPEAPSRFTRAAVGPGLGIVECSLCLVPFELINPIRQRRAGDFHPIVTTHVNGLLFTMVDFADAVDADGKSFLARLDLEGQVQRIMA
jgi:hypothetical protein